MNEVHLHMLYLDLLRGIGGEVGEIRDSGGGDAVNDWLSIVSTVE
jgi:hypothetical protein